MAKIIVGNHEVVNTPWANETIAHLQLATQRRFFAGEGYFLTILRWSDRDGKKSGPLTVWISPATELVLEYDADEPVDVDEALVQRFLSAMEEPHGLAIAFDSMTDMPPQGPFAID
jgi:hypothetical protein